MENDNKKEIKEEKTDSKKAYSPPQVISDDVFETMALSCTNQGPILCPAGSPANS